MYPGVSGAVLRLAEDPSVVRMEGAAGATVSAAACAGIPINERIPSKIPMLYLFKHHNFLRARSSTDRGIRLDVRKSNRHNQQGD